MSGRTTRSHTRSQNKLQTRKRAPPSRQPSPEAKRSKPDTSDEENLRTWSREDIQALAVIEGMDLQQAIDSTTKSLRDYLASLNLGRRWDSVNDQGLQTVRDMITREEARTAPKETDEKHIEVDTIPLMRQATAVNGINQEQKLISMAAELIRQSRVEVAPQGTNPQETQKEKAIKAFAQRYNLKLNWVKKVAQNEYVSIQEARINDALATSAITNGPGGHSIAIQSGRRSKIPGDYAEYSRLLSILMEARSIFGLQVACGDNQYTVFMRDYVYRLLTPVGAFAVDELVRSSNAAWWPLNSITLAKLPFLVAIHKKDAKTCIKCGAVEHTMEFCPNGELIYHAKVPQKTFHKTPPPYQNIQQRPTPGPAQDKPLCRWFMETPDNCRNRNCKFNHKCPACTWIKKHRPGCTR